MSRWARRRDTTHAPMVAELRALGVTVLDMANMGNDVPDLLVRRRECVLLVEVKSPKQISHRVKAGGLSPGQQRFAADWAGLVIRAERTEEVLAALDRAEFAP